jgi:hypothetical protein
MNFVLFLLLTCKTNRSSKLTEEIGTLNFVLLQQSPITASKRFCMGIPDYFLRTKPLFNSFFFVSYRFLMRPIYVDLQRKC